MYKISEEEYYELAQWILDSLTSPCYFTGVVAIEGVSDDVTIRLTASLILYRRQAKPFIDGDEGDTIYKVVDVWWDIECEGADGVRECDFDLERLKYYIIMG